MNREEQKGQMSVSPDHLWSLAMVFMARDPRCTLPDALKQAVDALLELPKPEQVEGAAKLTLSGPKTCSIVPGQPHHREVTKHHIVSGALTGPVVNIALVEETHR